MKTTQAPRLLLRLAAAVAAAAAFAPAVQAAAVAPSPAAAVTPVPADRQMTKADVDAWLDGLVPAALSSGDIAGAVVVVVKDGQVLTQRGFGYSDVAKKTPVDPETTLFRPGSISKLFAWTAVMQLVEQGKLDLDADVNRYLDFKIPARDGKPVTLRNIMTHTAGFEEALKGIMGPEPAQPLGPFLKAWIPERAFAPGAVPAYSNYASALAGYIVQRVSGEKTYEDYAQRHILGPLGMNRSTLHQPLPANLQPLMTTGYKQASGPAQYYEYIGPAPAGSLAASGADMARFMIAHLSNGTYNGVQILKPETAIQMHAPQPWMFPGLDGMTLGFYQTNRNGHRVIAHNGGTQFFHSDLHLFIDDGVGIFISLSSPGKSGAAPRLHEALFEGFTDRYLPASGPLPAATVDKATALNHAQLVAGPYQMQRRGVSTFLSLFGLAPQLTLVANPDGTLSIPAGVIGAERRYEEISPFLWRELGGQKKLEVRIENGEPALLGMSGVAPVAFAPVPAWRSPAWLLPAFGAALLALLLTGLSWPAAALARRRYGARFALSGQPALAYRAVRAFSLGTVATVVAFVALTASMYSNLALASARSDGLLLTLQGLTLLFVGGGALIALWNLVLVWRGQRGWFARVWSTVVALSALLLLWVALVFHLIGFNTNY